MIINKRKIGIIRGLMPRSGQVEFASQFRQFDPVFITGEAGVDVKKYCQQLKLEHRDLLVKPVYGIDPIEMLLGRRIHQSWLAPDSKELLAACSDLDVIETYELYHFFSGQAADVAKKYRIPLICEVWTSFLHLAYTVPPYSFTVRKVIDNASLIVARSGTAKKALLQYGVDKNKIKVIYHGVNIDRFKPKPKRTWPDLRVLYVGDLVDYKGVGILLDVWPKVMKVYPNAKLWLAGKGALLARAQHTVGVQAFGQVPYDRLPTIYNSCDLFVAPSQERHILTFKWWEEFFSYTLMEALASGLPIISTRSGGIPEEIGRENWLIPLNNSQALFKAQIEALSDHNLLKKIGDNNRKKAEELYNLKVQIKVLEDEILKF